MGKKISKNQARQWTSSYQQNGKGAKSVMFEKADLLALLNQPECEGLRIYNAIDVDNSEQPFTMFLVGTKADGTNLLPSSEEALNETYFIWDDGQLCPPFCPPNDL
jgi:hypothetical protein